MTENQWEQLEQAARQDGVDPNQLAEMFGMTTNADSDLLPVPTLNFADRVPQGEQTYHGTPNGLAVPVTNAGFDDVLPLPKMQW